MNMNMIDMTINPTSFIVAGGRDYKFTDEDIDKLNNLNIQELVSGNCKGADKCGEEWANSNNIPVVVFPADWAKHGRAAGPLRNREMARFSHAVVLFPGGAGTQSMHNEALKENLIIYDYR